MIDHASGAPKLLVLVDGSSYLYRAFHAMPALMNSRGEPTGAIYGVVNMLRRLMATEGPSHVAVVFDAPGPTFRDEIFPAYKAHRPPMPAELVSQIEPVHAMIAAMGLPVLQETGVEADDVIATLATQAADAGFDVTVSTSDKDLAQLVSPRIRLANTMTGTVLDRDGVFAKYGVPPERITDWLALMGDKSDNVPGIAGVGEKTAAKWLHEFGSLDALVERAAEVKGKAGEALRAGLPQLAVSKALVTVRRDVPLSRAPEDLVPEPPDTASLRALYGRYEFKNWLSELGTAGEPVTSMRSAAHYEMIVDAEALDRWITRLREAPWFAFDTETTSLDAQRAELVGLSFAVTPHEAAYVPLAHEGSLEQPAPVQLDTRYVLEQLRALLEDEHPRVIGQNLKYDMNVLARAGVTLRAMAHDTMLESYVLDSTATRHDMDSLSLKYLGHKTITYEEVAGKGKGQIPFAQVGLERATNYAAEDADVTLRLHQALFPRIAQEPALSRLYHEIELPLVPVLARIERNGVRIDTALLARQSAEIAARLGVIEQAAHAEAGSTFNMASPKQIQEILFGRLGIPVLRKTPTGQPSTAEDVLEELALDHALPRMILEHRSLSKLKGTYTDRLPEMVNPDTGRVHTSYHQAVAATGRLSSSDPNLQNIPIRTEEGRRIRHAFVAEPGHVLLSADYSQIELRILAHLSGDEGLRRAFAEGQDIHRATASEVFGTPLDRVTDDMRRAAKAINFGLVYGMSAFGLARSLRIEQVAAADYMERYFRRYPGVRHFMDEIRATARRQGYVETLFGRRLHVPDIAASNAARRQAAERTAINAPMQGTAADLIKRAMITLDRWILDDAPTVRMILQVHDELVLEVPEGLESATEQALQKAMCGAAHLSVPLVVDVGRGKNWGDAH